MGSPIGNVKSYSAAVSSDINSPDGMVQEIMVWKEDSQIALGSLQNQFEVVNGKMENVESNRLVVDKGKENVKVGVLPAPAESLGRNSRINLGGSSVHHHQKPREFRNGFQEGREFRNVCKCEDCTEGLEFDLCEECCYSSSSKLPGRFYQQHTPEHKFKIVQPLSLKNMIWRVNAEDLDDISYIPNVDGTGDDSNSNSEDQEGDLSLNLLGLTELGTGSSREEATPIPFNIAAILMTLWLTPLPDSRLREYLEDPDRTYFLEEFSLPNALHCPSRLLVLKHEYSPYFEIFDPQSREFTLRIEPLLQGVQIRGYSFDGWLLCSHNRKVFYLNIITGEHLELPRAPYTIDNYIGVFEGPPSEDNYTKLVVTYVVDDFVLLDILTRSEGGWDTTTYQLEVEVFICGLVLHEGNMLGITSDARLHVLTPSEHFSQELPFLDNVEDFGLYNVSIVTGGESMYLLCVGLDGILFHKMQEEADHRYIFTEVYGFGKKCIYATGDGSGQCFLANQPSEEGKVFFGCRIAPNRHQCWVIDVVDGVCAYEPQVIKECSAEVWCDCRCAWIGH